MKPYRYLSTALFLAVPVTGLADFQYQEKTQITGGSVMAAMKLAGAVSKQARQATDPIVSSVYVKGNRMLRVSQTNSEIIDLDKETITQIDHTKKQYTVITFAQLKQQLEKAAAKAQEESKKPQSAAAPSDTQMSFDVKVRETGATKTVSGLDAKEAILNMNLRGTDTQTKESGALAMTNDMWMVSDVPGYGELRDFQMRYAAKVGMMFTDSFTRTLRAMQPGLMKGTTEMVKEMSKLKGVPVLQVMRVGSTVNGQPLPAASEAPLPPSSDVSLPSGSDIAKSAGAATAASVLESRMKGLGSLAGGLGGFGGFGRGKKKKSDAPADQTADTAVKAPADTKATAYGVLMESNSEMNGFSTALIDGGTFQLPQGYKQVAPQE